MSDETKRFTVELTQRHTTVHRWTVDLEADSRTQAITQALEDANEPPAKRETETVETTEVHGLYDHETGTWDLWHFDPNAHERPSLVGLVRVPPPDEVGRRQEFVREPKGFVHLFEVEPGMLYPERAIRGAVREFMGTPLAERSVDIEGGLRDWITVCTRIPNEIWRRHGVRLLNRGGFEMFSVDATEEVLTDEPSS